MEATSLRPRIVIMAGLAGLFVLAGSLIGINVAAGNLHMDDLPFFSETPTYANSGLAEGHLLYCSGIEEMTPAAALAWLKAEDFSVTIVHDRPAGSTNVRTIPKGAVLQDVGVAGRVRRAFMFVMTPEHPRFEEGYFGGVPPQNC